MTSIYTLALLKEINEAKKKQREEGKAKNSVDDDNGDDDNDDDDDRNEGGNDDDGKGKEKEGDGGKEGGSSKQKALLNYVFDSAPSISLLSHEEEDRLLALASTLSQKGEVKLVTADSSKSACEINNNGTNVKNEESVDKSNNDDKDDDNNDESKEENNNETSTTKQATEDTSDVNISIEKVRWMYEVVEEGWIMYSNEASRELEQASRDNKVSHTITIGNDVHTIKLDNRRYTRSNADGEFKIRRHNLGDGLSGLWEVLTMKYEKPSGLYGIGILKILEKVWSKKETMSGQQCGLGFMFLYNLYTGESRCKVSGGGGINDFKGGIGPQMNPFFMFGGKKLGSGSSSSSSNDSHRFALLLTQLYTDKHMKSLPASVLNILGKKKYYIINVYVYTYFLFFSRSFLSDYITSSHYILYIICHLVKFTPTTTTTTTIKQVVTVKLLYVCRNLKIIVNLNKHHFSMDGLMRMNQDHL